MSEEELAEFVHQTAAELGIPGAVVAVLADGHEVFAGHGVTSIENPLPVDENTVFVAGSVAKTFTATALMALVADGRVRLDEPLRSHLPEFRLADQQAADEITVRQLLNHTAGLPWRLDAETGEGRDALAAYVARIVDVPLVAPPGTEPSYSQVGFNVVGRLIETVTGEAYEDFVKARLLRPIGLTRSGYGTTELITRRFAVGHNQTPDGELTVARHWIENRANNPGGGLATSPADLIRWARFHLADGEGILPAEIVRQMRQPTVELHGSSLGDAIGISWFLREIDGVMTYGHGGSADGQFSDLLLVPERNLAVVTMANAGPDTGMAFNRSALRWALQRFAGMTDRDPDPLPYDAARSAELVGDYEDDMMVIMVRADEEQLTLTAGIKPEIRAGATEEMPPDLPPAEVGLLPDDGFIVTEGGLAGQRGSFDRADDGTVERMRLVGRFATRTAQ